MVKDIDFLGVWGRRSGLCMIERFTNTQGLEIFCFSTLKTPTFSMKLLGVLSSLVCFNSTTYNEE
jgi:hypothetical protein